MEMFCDDDGCGRCSRELVWNTRKPEYVREYFQDFNVLSSLSQPIDSLNHPQCQSVHSICPWLTSLWNILNPRRGIIIHPFVVDGRAAVITDPNLETSNLPLMAIFTHKRLTTPFNQPSRRSATELAMRAVLGAIASTMDQPPHPIIVVPALFFTIPEHQRLSPLHHMNASILRKSVSTLPPYCELAAIPLLHQIL